MADESVLPSVDRSIHYACMLQKPTEIGEQIIYFNFSCFDNVDIVYDKIEYYIVEIYLITFL